MIHIEQLVIGYRERKTVKKEVAGPISADIHSGELTCLLGPNGVGKSTLLRTLSAFQHKLGGSIYLQGKELDDYTAKQLSHIVSVVLTERCTIRNMTATELIGMGRSPYTDFWGNLRKEDKEMVAKAAQQVGIEPLLHRMVHTLSDGERQKVMIAKALAQETPIIFLDEPTAFLDFPSKVDIMQLLHRISRQAHKTIFLSSHDLELALQIADKVWLMGPDNAIAIGTPEDLAIDGRLNRFFARKGISFDERSGLFKIVFEHDAQIRLVGEGPRYDMVRKALDKNRILAGKDVESDKHIEVNDCSFSFHRPGCTPVVTQSIEQLLQAVLSH